MNFWNNPNYNAVKVFLVCIVFAGAGFVVYNFTDSPLVDKAAVINPMTMQVGTAGALATTSGPTLLSSLNVGAAPTDSAILAASKVLYVQGTSIFSGSIGVRGQLGITQGDGSVKSPAAGGNTLYVQGVPVCLQNGVDCPSGSTAGSSGSDWTISGSNLLNANSGQVILGSSTSNYGSKLFVSGTTRLDPGAGLSAASAASSIVLSVAPGISNFDSPGTVGGVMAINGENKTLTIGGQITGGINVNGESHFANSSYVDPVPGMAESIKANSIGVGTLNVDNLALGGAVNDPAAPSSGAGTITAGVTPRLNSDGSKEIYIVNTACQGSGADQTIVYFSYLPYCVNKYGSGYINTPFMDYKQK